MRRKGPRPVALDHNFPKTVLAPLIDKELFPGVVFHWIYDVREDLADFADHNLIWELHRIGFSVMATCDYRMLRDPRVLVAIEQTRLSVLAVRSATHDPVLATGVLLRDLMPAMRRDHPHGLVFECHSSQVEPRRARKRLEAHATEEVPVNEIIRRHTLPFPDRCRYENDDPRRFV